MKRAQLTLSWCGTEFRAVILIAAVIGMTGPTGASCPSQLIWQERYGPMVGVFANAVAVDISGNVVVVGSEQRDLGEYANWLIRKYDTAGTLLWSRTYNSPANFVDVAYGVAVDVGGNVVVAGVENRSDLGQSVNWLIRKYDSTGTLLWNKTYNNPSNDADSAYGVAVDGSGNIVIAGTEKRTDLGQSHNWLIRKYDSAGALIWNKTYNGLANGSDGARVVAVDGSGNIVVAGYEDRSDLGQSTNWLIRKYDSAGTFLWSKTYNNPSNSGDGVSGVAVDGSGNIVVAGTEDRDDLGENDNWLVRKYNSAGTLLWSRTYTLPVNRSDKAHAVAIDTNGNVVVAGIRNGLQADDLDWLMRKYDSTGALTWSKSYDSPANGEARGVAIDASNNIIVAGYEGLGPGYNLLVTKYAAISACLDATLSIIPSTSWVGQWFTVHLTVTNAGGVRADDVAASITVSSGASLLTYENGPIPSGFISIIGGETQVFTWTYSASGVGPITFAATVAGTDSDSGSPINDGASGSVLISSQAQFASSLVVMPAEASVGEWATIVLTVTNTGSVNATGVISALQINSGASLTIYEEGPSPVGPLTVAPGVPQSFTWTYSISGAGTVEFTATVSGTDSASGDPVSISASATLTTTPAPPPSAQALARIKVAIGELLVAPNVLDRSVAANQLIFHVKGNANEKVELNIYSEMGELMGTLPTTLDGSGYGAISCCDQGIGGKHIPPGIYWALARGGGVNDKKRFLVVE